MSAATAPGMEGDLRRFKRYPVYQDSGVDWLGEVPEDWHIRRLRSTVTDCQNGLWGDEPDGENDVVCVRVADFDRATFRVNMDNPTLRSVEARALAGRLLRPGDLLLEKSGGGEKQPVGAVVLFDHGALAVCSNFIARMPIVSGFSPRFLAYLHAALYSLRINTRSIKQSIGIQNLDSAQYLSESVAFPEIGEQKSIASFLDGETAKIDELVAKKERLIELLQEKRSAQITRAVTQGLDPTVPMKDSGVEWLGEIPAHWKTSPLKLLVPQITVGIVVTPSKYYADHGVPCLRSLNITRGYIDLKELVFISNEANEFNHKSQIFEGDVVVVRTGRAGTAVVVPRYLHRANCIDLLIIRRSDRVHSQFLYYFINSSATSAQVEAHSVGAIQGHYNTGTLKNLWLPVVPAAEQLAIGNHLDEGTARIDALVNKVREAIDTLEEFRTALISAAVTGKIDVREEVA